MELFWRQAPLLRILFPLVIGITTALRFEECSVYQRPLVVSVFALVLLLILGKSLWKRLGSSHFFGLVSSILFFACGLTLGYRGVTRDMDIVQAESYLAIVESMPLEKRRSYAVQLKIVEYQVDSVNFASTGRRVMAYFAKDGFDHNLVPGQSVLFSGNISKPDSAIYPRQFDYGQYLRSIGISGTVYIRSGACRLVEQRHFSVKAGLNGLRASILHSIKKDSIPSREYGVIAALLLGDRSTLDPELRSDFADAGAIHILAVSGLHVGIIYLLCLKILSFFFKERFKLLTFILILLFLWSYAALTGLSPSVMRAATMFSFIAFGKYHKRHTNIYNMIAASAILLLVVDPLLIGQIGFQLSYLAVIGIIFYQPKLVGWLPVQNRYLYYVWSLVCVSVAAQLTTFPLSIYYFHQFPMFFFIANIFVIPLASVILYGGVAWLLLSWLPLVSDLLRYATIWSTKLLNELVGLVNVLPLAKIDGLYFSEFAVFLIYLVMVLVTAFLIKPSRLRLRVAAVSVVCLVVFALKARLEMINRDRLVFPTSGYESTCIRQVQDRLYVATPDTARFRNSWQRELYPYFLSQRMTDPNSILFMTDVFDGQPLSLRSVHSNEHHVLWNERDKEIHFVDETAEARRINYSNAVLTEIEVGHLTRFSSDSLPLRRSPVH